MKTFLDEVSANLKERARRFDRMPNTNLRVILDYCQHRQMELMGELIVASTNSNLGLAQRTIGAMQELERITELVTSTVDERERIRQDGRQPQQ